MAWPKNKSVENQQSTNSKTETQKLQTELNSLRSKLKNVSGNTKKTQLENKLTSIENQINNSQNNSLSQSTIKKLEQEIKEINQAIEGKDKPNQDNPDRNDNPDPNPNPQPNPDPSQKTKFIVTKINDNTYKYRFTVDNDNQNCQGYDEVNFGNFLGLLGDPNYGGLDKNFFHKAFQAALKDANSKLGAYFWKCPPVSLKTIGKPFEFVVIKSDTLNNIQQDYSSFQEHFGKSQDNQAVSFFSPSGNLLVSPVPKGTADYKNISQFTKNAPEEQQQALWKEVADSLYKELEKDTNTPRWLNTEGTGVPYLHVRIDTRNGFYSNYPEYAKWG